MPIYGSAEDPLRHYNHFLASPEEEKAVKLIEKYDRFSKARAEGREFRLSAKEKQQINAVENGVKELIPPLYMGIEIEMESKSGDPNVGLEEMLGSVSEFVIGKSDGSLRRGVEVVSVPATLAVHKDRWPKLLAVARKYYRSWDPFGEDTSNCGMHIHLDRRAITIVQLSKMMLFINSSENSEFLSKLAGRTINTSSHYCKTITFKKATDLPHVVRDKYNALNLVKPKTVEIRIFRGVINEFNFMKNIEFAHAYHKYCGVASFKTLGWKEFVYWVTSPSQRGEYYHLVTWMARNYEAVVHPDAVKLKTRYAAAEKEPSV